MDLKERFANTPGLYGRPLASRRLQFPRPSVTDYKLGRRPFCPVNAGGDRTGTCDAGHSATYTGQRFYSDLGIYHGQSKIKKSVGQIRERW